VLPRVAVAIEHYGRIFRTIEKNIPVTLAVNIVNKLYETIWIHSISSRRFQRGQTDESC